MYCQVLPGQNSSAAVPVVASNSIDTAIDYDNDSEDYVILDNPLGSGGECRRDIYCISYLLYLVPTHLILYLFNDQAGLPLPGPGALCPPAGPLHVSLVCRYKIFLDTSYGLI